MDVEGSGDAEESAGIRSAYSDGQCARKSGTMLTMGMEMVEWR